MNHPTPVTPSPFQSPVIGSSRAASEVEVEVWVPSRQGVAEHPAAPTDHADPGRAVTVPVADDRQVPGLTEDEVVVGVAGAVELRRSQRFPRTTPIVWTPLPFQSPTTGISPGCPYSITSSASPGPSTWRRYQTRLVGSCDAMPHVLHHAAVRTPELEKSPATDSRPMPRSRRSGWRGRCWLPSATARWRRWIPRARPGRALGGRVGEQAGGALGVGRLGHSRGRGARRVPFPSRNTSDHATSDRPNARLVVVALPVAEPGAAGLALTAAVVIAVAIAGDTCVAAGPRAATAAHPPQLNTLFAVQVVAAVAVAIGVALCPPPTGHDVPGRTGVYPGDVAAEFGPSVVAAGTGADWAGADALRVGAARAEQVGGGRCSPGGSHHGRPSPPSPRLDVRESRAREAASTSLVLIRGWPGTRYGEAVPARGQRGTLRPARTREEINRVETGPDHGTTSPPVTTRMAPAVQCRWRSAQPLNRPRKPSV